MEREIWSGFFTKNINKIIRKIALAKDGSP